MENELQNKEYCPQCGRERMSDEFKCQVCECHTPAQDFPQDNISAELDSAQIFPIPKGERKTK